MKAAVFYDHHSIKIEDVPTPIPQAGEVLIDIIYCGICGTDLHEYLQGPMSIPTKECPHALTKGHLPVTMGHEMVGKVRETFSNSSALRVGQTVVVDPRLNCQTCDTCQNGQSQLCDKWGFIGLSGGRNGGGGFAEQVIVQERMCHVLPDGISAKDAALIEPLVVARHAMTATGITNWTGVTALVLGGGPIGLAVLRTLAIENGVGTVFVSEPSEGRRQCVDALGWVREVLDPMKTKVSEHCKDATAARGVDVVFDCAGVSMAMNDGFAALRKHGIYMNVAGWEKPFVLPFGLWMTREITVKASMAYNEVDFERVVSDFVEGKYRDIGTMVTGCIPLDDIVSKGFQELIANKDKHVKILVTPKQVPS